SVDFLETADAESVHPPLSDKDHRNAAAAEGLVVAAGSDILLDVVLEVRNAALAEIIAGLLAVRAPAGGIHDNPRLLLIVGHRRGHGLSGHQGCRAPQQQDAEHQSSWTIRHVGIHSGRMPHFTPALP